MHIVHLALGMDAISAVLLDLTDDTANVLPGQTRDQRLVHVWNSYHEWCEAERHLGKNTKENLIIEDQVQNR